jgi:hypothetical protein
VVRWLLATGRIQEFRLARRLASTEEEAEEPGGEALAEEEDEEGGQGGLEALQLNN